MMIILSEVFQCPDRSRAHRLHYLSAAAVFPELNRPGREALVNKYFVNYLISLSVSSDGRMLDDLKWIWKKILAA
jgi:hypothetical protein